MSTFLDYSNWWCHKWYKGLGCEQFGFYCMTAKPCFNQTILIYFIFSCLSCGPTFCQWLHSHQATPQHDIIISLLSAQRGGHILDWIFIQVQQDFFVPQSDFKNIIKGNWTTELLKRSQKELASTLMMYLKQLFFRTLGLS